MKRYDVVIIGAGAAGMMCAVEAGRRGRQVLVIEHGKKPGEKIRISGGGRCNFTNLYANDDITQGRGGYLSANPRFCVSALKRYTPQDFIEKIERRGISWHEKTLGQLFCDGPATQIVDMFLAEMREAGVELRLSTTARDIERAPNLKGDGFTLMAGEERIACASLVIATGGKSIPKMGATGFAYEVAQKFAIPLIEPRPALVPLTFEAGLLEETKALSGVAIDARVTCGKRNFDEAVLFTHRGLSGPAILQISSYWREGDALRIDMAPGTDVFEALRSARSQSGKQAVQTALATILPKSLAQAIAAREAANAQLGALSDKALRRIANAVNDWTVKPVGSEGYRTAEVTLGGVDTRALDGKTMEARDVPGLHFIGEAVDVTGWLGGYNFQWAWASGVACGVGV
ncbi:NAD(P)/FAD-dependent oxidoreductase [Breoghania sp.]|uniref:NAD(P)/FAD-dependent oxidoreductase n=1 Tax=Breoghania sp. TaxID=2065378 RepID=UPI002AA88D79|nr:NAD(P)/FAD-dependent oxidoreductase [Breoghania sp.]